MYKKYQKRLSEVFCSLATFLLMVAPLQAQGFFKELMGEKDDACKSASTGSIIVSHYPGQLLNTCYFCPLGSSFEGSEASPKCSVKGTHLSPCDKGGVQGVHDRDKNICIHCLSGTFNGDFKNPQCN